MSRIVFHGDGLQMEVISLFGLRGGAAQLGLLGKQGSSPAQPAINAQPNRAKKVRCRCHYHLPARPARCSARPTTGSALARPRSALLLLLLLAIAGDWASATTISGRKKKSFLPPSILDRICFSSLDHKTDYLDSSNFRNRSCDLL